MLTIVPADEATTLRCRREAERGGNCLSMTENGEWKGFCLYDFADEKLVIHTLHTEDELLAEGLIRAAVNIARNRQIPVALCTDGRFPAMLERLGFIKEEYRWLVEVEAFFKPCCGGCH